MKRRVFRNGPSFVMTLPNTWVKAYGIQKGQELEVTTEGNTLSISVASGKDMALAEIDTKGIDRTFLRCSIRSAYKKGYDEIRVNYHTPTLKHYRLDKQVGVPKIVSEEVESLIGFEVIENNKTSIIIKGFSKEHKEDFDIFLRKIFLNLIQYAQDLENVPYDKSIFEQWELKHWNIKKFINYCIRILNKKGHVRHEDTTLLYHLISSLDIILGVIQHTGRYVQEHKLTYGNHTKNIVADIIGIFSHYYELFYHYSNEKVVEFSLRRNAIKESIVTFADKISPKETLFLDRFYQTVELFYRLMEIRMDLEHND